MHDYHEYGYNRLNFAIVDATRTALVQVQVQMIK